jgi:uncharacterized protein (DUF58 family)
MRAALASRWSAILGIAEKRLPALTRLKRSEPLPIALHRRRIYVVPTRFGLVFSLMLIVMLLGALNYNNNPALLLTCLLAAAAYQSVFSGFGALNRVELRAIKAQACSAGENLHLALFFSGDGAARQSLRCRMENAAPTDISTAGFDGQVFDIPAEDDGRVATELPAPRRGWQAIGRIRVWSEYPYGLFHVWSWLHPDTRALIYPRAEAHPPPLPHDGDAAQSQSVRRSGDEFGMLRDYHPSDPRRLIAWKASARHGSLLVKEFEQRQSREVVLDWQHIEGLDYEARISRLAAWVERAEAAGAPYSLALPHLRLGPGLGSEHRDACLRELALLPDAGA